MEAHKEARGARCGGPQGGPGSSLWGPTRRPGELVVGAHKEAWGASYGGPQGGTGSSSWGPTRRPGELVAGARGEARGARCASPQGGPGNSLRRPRNSPGELLARPGRPIFRIYICGLRAGPPGPGSSLREPRRSLGELLARPGKAIFRIYIYVFCDWAPRHHGGPPEFSLMPASGRILAGRRIQPLDHWIYAFGSKTCPSALFQRNHAFWGKF